jgi:hypothetical protein
MNLEFAQNQYEADRRYAWRAPWKPRYPMCQGKLVVRMVALPIAHSLAMAPGM